MRAQITKYWEALWSSFWFIPTVMALGAIVLSLVTTLLDASPGFEWVARIEWLSFNTPAGARALLSTIAGSMITVAGVTFSITIAAVAYASSQLGPRLLGNFMRDKSNQVTLGTYVATFLYGLLILRTVQGEGDDAERFMPHLGLMVALALTLASLGVLIHFIHHVPRSIQASVVIANLGAELCAKLEQLFPSHIGKAPPDERRPLPEAAQTPGDGVPVRARTSGYLTRLDGEALLNLSRENDLLLRLACRPGDFVGKDEVLARAYGRVPDDVIGRVARSFALDRQRTPAQDVLFVVQQLVEIAARALSPGVNDPFTAMTCMDWLGTALVNLGQRAEPSSYRYDGEGRLRVVAPGVSFTDVAAAVFDQLRPYAGADRNATLHLLAVIGRVLANVRHPPYRASLLEHAGALQTTAETALDDPRDLAQISTVFARLEQHRTGA